MLVPIVLHPGLAPGQAEVIVDPGTPIIAISGSGPVDSTGYLQVAHALGAVLTLNKPFEARALLDAVEQAAGNTAHQG